MSKAERLIAAGVARASMLLPVPRPVVEIDGRVLVTGGGGAAVVCANALRMQGFVVAHSEELPVAIAGSLGQFTVTLSRNHWQWQVDASVVVLAPTDESQVAHFVPQRGLFVCPVEGDATMTGTALAAQVGALLGSGQILADHNVARVDPFRCLGCGTCESVCEYRAVRTVEVGDPTEPDLIRLLIEETDRGLQDESVPMVAQVNAALCQGCGTCAATCPSSAIQAGCSSDRQIEAMLTALLG
jgi:heterodisulfide reductase subunit A-like polyferredoxin